MTFTCRLASALDRCSHLDVAELIFVIGDGCCFSVEHPSPTPVNSHVAIWTLPDRPPLAMHAHSAALNPQLRAEVFSGFRVLGMHARFAALNPHLKS